MWSGSSLEVPERRLSARERDGSLAQLCKQAASVVLHSHTQLLEWLPGIYFLFHLTVTGTRGLFCARQWSKHFTKLTHLTLIIAYEVDPSILCS